MQGLMLKLLNVDAAGERALRVVAYFDQLGANNPEVDALVRAAALIADCSAGLEFPGLGLSVRFTAEGTPLVGPPAHRSETRDLTSEDGERGSVWLERDEPSLELDEFIVERFGLTAAAAISRRRSTSTFTVADGFADPALAQLLINGRASEAERSRAARLIGLQPATTIQLIAIEPDPSTTIEDIVRSLRGAWDRQLYVAELSRQLAVLLAVGRTGVDWTSVTLPGRFAAGPVVEILDAPSSWAIARQTLRFAGTSTIWPNILESREIGAVRLLSQLDPADIAGEPDVVAIGRLAASPSGAESLFLLDNFLQSDSVRSAARATNFHHSSLQARITRIGAELGLDLASPPGRQRAMLALLLWRVGQSH